MNRGLAGAMTSAGDPSTAFGFEADLPPQCPKCGCHRIRVVGQPLHSALRFLRCEDCETTSALLTRQRK